MFQNKAQLSLAQPPQMQNTNYKRLMFKYLHFLANNILPNRNYANDDKINSYKIVQYSGENHHYDAEDESQYPHY
jgi:hypothetical protein